MSRLARTVRLAALGGAGALAVRAVAARRRTLAPVPAEMRHPLLWFPTSVRDERTLGIGRTVLARLSEPVAPGVTVERRAVPGSAAEVVLYQPAERARPSGALVWVHGGGLVMGRAEESGGRCSQLAAELGILAVSVEYRLAPEHPFPAGLDDCMAALRWVHDHADELGVDPARVAVGGDSAGGGLAAAMAQRARDEGGPPIALQLLVYPMLDDRTSAAGGPETLVWTPTSNRWAWGAYLGHPAGAAEDRPYAVPARCADLAGLPPAWLGVGTNDIFHDEDVTYARRLIEAGVPCDLVVIDGMYHGTDALRPGAAGVRRFTSGLTDALRTAIA